MSADAELRIVEAMRLGAASLSAIREATGLKAAEVSAAVQAMRYQGKVAFGRLELSPSMMVEAVKKTLPRSEQEQDSAAAAAREASPGHAAEAGRDVPASGEEPDAQSGGGDKAPPPPARPTSRLAEEVNAEAREQGDRRRSARMITGTTRGLPRPLTATAIQTLEPPEPSEVVRAVNRVHPRLWRRCVAVARPLNISPFAALYRALGAGLDLIEADLGEQGS